MALSKPDWARSSTASGDERDQPAIANASSITKKAGPMISIDPAWRWVKAATSRAARTANLSQDQPALIVGMNAKAHRTVRIDAATTAPAAKSVNISTIGIIRSTLPR